MQKRVKGTILIEKNKLLFEDNNLFSGIVFFEKDNGFLTANYVEKGMVTDEYIPYCLPDDVDKNVKIIDGDTIEFDGERAIINDGEIYSGIAIDFDHNGYSYIEEYYDEDGIRASDVCWNKDMTVRSFYLDHGVIYESGEFTNGKLSRYNLGKYFFIRINNKNELDFIDINKRFFILKKEVFKLLIFFPMNKISDIYCWNFSEELYLSGDYVDNDCVFDFFRNNKLNNIKKINFYQTHINDYSFLLKLKKIEEVNISTNNSSLMSEEGRKNNEFLREHLTKIFKEFKLQNRNVKITLNRVELKL